MKTIIYLLITIIILVIIVIKVQYYFKTVEEFDKYGFTCNQCSDGEQPNEERTACEECPTGWAGTGGICSQCDDRKEPNDEKN